LRSTQTYAFERIQAAVFDVVNSQTIVRCDDLIRPHIRHTPIVGIKAADIGLDNGSLFLKLEFLQYSGSFKVRGAFANLLSRPIPGAGVVAASGGNHGAAVAYAAMRLGVPAKIFVPSVSSPSKIKRIREYGAHLVIEGDRYADALAASEIWAQDSGALPVHAYDQNETIIGQGTLAPELDNRRSARHGTRAGRRRGINPRSGGLLCWSR
jgi:threonine dehydratase